jgi:hypothetical protein
LLTLVLPGGIDVSGWKRSELDRVLAASIKNSLTIVIPLNDGCTQLASFHWLGPVVP